MESVLVTCCCIWGGWSGGSWCPVGVSRGRGGTGGGWAGLGWRGAWQPAAGTAASPAEDTTTSKLFCTWGCFCSESKRFCVQQHLFYLFIYFHFGLTSLSQETTQGKSVCFPNSASINLNLQSCSGLYKDLLIKTFAKYWLRTYSVRPERSSAK